MHPIASRRGIGKNGVPIDELRLIFPPPFFFSKTLSFDRGYQFPLFWPKREAGTTHVIMLRVKGFRVLGFRVVGHPGMHPIAS